MTAPRGKETQKTRHSISWRARDSGKTGHEKIKKMRAVFRASLQLTERLEVKKLRRPRLKGHYSWLALSRNKTIRKLFSVML